MGVEIFGGPAYSSIFYNHSQRQIGQFLILTGTACWAETSSNRARGASPNEVYAITCVSYTVCADATRCEGRKVAQAIAAISIYNDT